MGRKVVLALAAAFALLSNACSDHQVKEEQVGIVREAIIIHEGLLSDRPILFSALSLQRSASTFKGKPVLISHEWGDPDKRVGTIISVTVSRDNDKACIKAEILITDPKAVEKIKLGLYHSMSVGISNINAICFIDNMTWGLCNHRAGEYYEVDGFILKCVIVVTRFQGMEVSFVNVPADEHARILPAIK